MGMKESNPSPPVSCLNSSTRGLNHLNLLGLKVMDRVTGFKGVVQTVAFDLYGCIQAVVAPEANKDDKLEDSHWFDVKRLKVLDKTPVMDIPDFDAGYVAEGKKGPSDKPIGRY